MNKSLAAVLGYARTSTVGQPLETQIELLEREGVQELFTEQRSGKNADRPSLEELLKYIRVGAGDTVVVTKLDRLARNVKDLLDIVQQIEDKGASLKILDLGVDTSGPMGRFILTLLGAVAEVERVMMLERQREGIARIKANPALKAKKYKGRRAVARAKIDAVYQLADDNPTWSCVRIGERLGISKSSVAQFLKERRDAQGEQSV